MKVGTAVRGLMLIFLVLCLSQAVCSQEAANAAGDMPGRYEKIIPDSKGNPRKIIKYAGYK